MRLGRRSRGGGGWRLNWGCFLAAGALAALGRRARLRRLLRRLFCLYACLRQAQRAALVLGKFTRQRFGLAFGGELRLGRRLRLPLRQRALHRCLVRAQRLHTVLLDLSERDLLQGCAMPRQLLGFGFGFAALLLPRLGRLFRLDPRFGLRRGLRIGLRALLRRAQRPGLAACALLRRFAQLAFGRLAPPRLVLRLLLESPLLGRGFGGIALDRLALFRFGFVLRQQSLGAGRLRQRAHFVRRKRIFHQALLFDFGQPLLDRGPVSFVFGRTRLRRGFVPFCSAGEHRRLAFAW